MLLKTIKGNISISTKNLYCAELREYQDRAEAGKIIVDVIPFYPKRFVLVRKKDNGLKCSYKDVFTRSNYKLYSDTDCEYGETVVSCLNPACTTKRRIKYKEAEELFENINNSYQKNRK